MALTQSYQLRFSGIGRLYGQKNLQHLAEAHFVVVGLGGVGSWAAEALARSGVGKITLIDMDEVCVTNINRQLPALTATVGRPKVAVLAERLTEINPEIELVLLEDFLDKTNIKQYILPEQDFVIDAIDAPTVKSALMAYCKARKIPLLMVGSAGGKSDPRQVTSADLGRTTSDPMLAKVRQQLYRWYNFARDKQRKFGVEAVYSTEQAVFPKPDGEVCMQKSAMIDGVKLDCSAGFGAASMLTGTMGFVAAERSIVKFLNKRQAA